MKQALEVRVLTPVADEISNQNPPTWLSCDWLTRNPLRFGIMLFPLHIYRQMEQAHAADRRSE